MIRVMVQEDAAYVAARMRDADKREVYATRWDENPLSLASAAACSIPFAYTALHEGKPAAVAGAVPIHPGVWKAWMFATDDWPFVALSLTKFMKNVMIPALVDIGVHRAECNSIEGHDTAHRWLEFLGAHRESTLPGYGKNQETFYCYVWRR